MALPQFKRGSFPLFREIQYCRVKSFWMFSALNSLMFIAGSAVLLFWPNIAHNNNLPPETWLKTAGIVLILLGATLHYYLKQFRLVTEV